MPSNIKTKEMLGSTMRWRNLSCHPISTVRTWTEDISSVIPFGAISNPSSCSSRSPTSSATRSTTLWRRASSAVRDTASRTACSAQSALRPWLSAKARMKAAASLVTLRFISSLMSPQTNLGSATPVSLGGDMSEEMKRKVTNDAAAYIRALADNHGRNADWAEQAVREAVSLTAEEALRQRVVDLVAEDVGDLLEQLDGFEIAPKGITLDMSSVQVRTVEMGWQERFLYLIVDPNISFVLMLLGIYGLLFELQSPGLGAPGIIGVICLLLALYSFQVLPVSYAGLALIVAAVGFFVAEVKIQSGGLLALGGTVGRVLGAMMLFDTQESFLRVDWLTIGIAAALTLLFFILVLGAVGRVFRRSPTTGGEGMVGGIGVAKESLDPRGQVSVHGELWQAVAEDPPIGVGDEVEVLSVKGLELRVRRRD